MFCETMYKVENFKINVNLIARAQRKFKLVKRRELSPPVTMKFFHTVKWVSGHKVYLPYVYC